MVPDTKEHDMTRKDFTLLADTLRGEIETADSQFEEYGAAALRAFAVTLADALAGTNDRFDRDRFLKACGAPGNLPTEPLGFEDREALLTEALGVAPGERIVLDIEF